MSILSKLSLKNRAVVALVALIVGAFGFISVGALKQELIPSIEIPSAAIVTSYPGASPEVVDAQVSGPLEQAVIGLEGIESTSVTSTTGLSVLRVSFEFGTSTQDATSRLNEALDGISIEGISSCLSAPTEMNPKAPTISATSATTARFFRESFERIDKGDL